MVTYRFNKYGEKYGEELKQKTTFRGLSDIARRTIAIAFRRRIDSLA